MEANNYNNMSVPELETEFLNLFTKEFPNVGALPWRYGNEDQTEYTHFAIPPINRDLIGSNYFESKQRDFYHFTSLEALQSIISTKTLRLFNLYNLDDPREYLFGANYLPHDKGQLDDAKRNFFVLSMLGNIDKMKSSEKFNMWRLYGNNGTGCILKVSVLNDPSEWHNFYLSKVHYGNRKVKEIKNIGVLLKLINEKRTNLGIDMGQLLCFHKSYLYYVEKEYRLLYDMREKKGMSHSTIYNSDYEVEFPIIRTKVDANYNPDIQYLEFPLLGHKTEPIDNHIPWIRIREIVLGYKLKTHFTSIKKQLRDLHLKNLGFVPSIKLSRLSKQFYGT